MRTLSLVLTTAMLAACATAPANRTISVSEMDQARLSAETPFQQCLTGARLNTTKSTLTESEIQSAESLKGNSTNYVSQSLGLAPFQSQSLLSGVSGPNYGAGLTFKLGVGYASEAQGWYQTMASGDVETASLLLAYERSGLLLPQANAAAPSLSNLTSFMSQDKDEETAVEDVPAIPSDGEIADKLGILGLIERGTLNLSLGNTDCAARFLDYAQNASEAQESKYFSGTLEGYEHIMMLNQKSMAYLLAGDKRARNMAIASRELQSRAREEHEAAIEEQLTQVKSQEGSQSVFGNPSMMEYVSAAFLNTPLAANAADTSDMTTPYVNPLADYLSAVISETEASAGTGRRDSWSQAANAWNNASRLSPNARFLSQAAADARARQNSRNSGEKVVHVLVGEGSSPHKIVGAIGVPMDDGIMPVMIPFMTRTPSTFTGGAVRIGNELAPLEKVADVEAMALKNAEDERSNEVYSALIRGYVAYEAGKLLGSNSTNVIANAIGTSLRDTLAEPSTDGWLSLPRTYQAARLVVPASETSATVTINTQYGQKTQTFSLLPDESTFILLTTRGDDVSGSAQSAAFASTALDFEAQ